MYRVAVVTDGQEYPLLNQMLRLQNPVLKENAGNTPGYLKFKITPQHPHYDKIHPLSSEVFVYEDGVEIFRGRSITSEEEFNRTHQLTCESDLAYLCDSIVRPFEFQGSIVEFMTQIVNGHNAQVESRKQFVLGRVNVVDSNNYINRSNSEYSCSMDCLRDKLVKTHGGYLRTRYEDGKRYLDYLTDGGGINEQAIRYGVNLVNYSKTQDATELFTALIPTGADLEETSTDGEITIKTVDIASVNNGKDFIYDPDAVQKYGWIFRQRKWEDVTLPENLIKKARAYLEQSIYLGDVLSLTAVDLTNIDVDVKRLKTGYWTKVISRPHGVDVLYILEERTRYLQEPGKDTISLGGTVATLSGSTAKSQKELSVKVEQIGQAASKGINQKISNATQLISGGLGGYVVIGRSENGQPEEILIMDAPMKVNAKNVIRLNKNGIGFSTSGYDGVYRNAWTIDGNLVADFITTGNFDADLIKAGTIKDRKGLSFWNMNTGEMNIAGVIEQLREDGLKSVQISNNGLWLYSYISNGSLMGSLSSMKSVDGAADLGVQFSVSGDNLLSIGYSDENNTIYPKIQINNDPDTPPRISGTASGTISIPGGGKIVVDNGLITSWEMPGLPTGYINYYDGKFGEIEIWVDSGAITKWHVDSN